MAGREPSVTAQAGGRAKQINIGGDNFGSFYFMSPGTARRHVHQLPFAPPDFVGRRRLVEKVRKRLTNSHGPGMVNLYGIPGAGKSAVALRLGNELGQERYPHCQLYFNLRRYDEHRVSAYDLLGGALVALGVPIAELPSGIEPRAAAYRSALSDLRCLVVVDNASTAAEVTPLLPGHSGSAVIITSWAPVAELPGVWTVPVPALDDGEAVDMLRAVAGRPVGAADLRTVRRIARLAGKLPLALRIAGGLLRTRTHWSWADLLERLADADGSARVDRFATGTLAVAAAFDLAYRELDPALARGYRRLGLAPSPSMSGALAQTLIDEDPVAARDIFDELVSRQLLQPETEASFRMHDLLWSRARALVAGDDEASRRAAVDRMTAWSLRQLGDGYLDRFRLDLSLGAPFELAYNDPSPVEIYVDSPVHDPGTATTTTLGELFPATPRVLLVAPGGHGKTTLVNHLCLSAAKRRARRSDALIPMIALIRDVSAEDEGDVTTLLLRTLRHRYEVDMSRDALQVVLRGGHAFVVLDGLDELVDPALRRAVLASIRRFAAEHPAAPVLVTSRPYSAARTDLAGFHFVTIPPWTREIAERYAAKLGRSTLDARSAQHVLDQLRRAEGRSAPEILRTPLGLQMSLSFFDRFGEAPATSARMIEAIIEAVAIEREYGRGTLYVDRDSYRNILRRIAFAMQSSTRNRVMIGLEDLRAIVEGALDGAGTPTHEGLVPTVNALIGRSVVLREVRWDHSGDQKYAFTHTAFREHLAAAHLARMEPDEFAAVVVAHAADASWEAVFATALELRGERDERFAGRVAEAVRRAGNPGLAGAVARWRDASR